MSSFDAHQSTVLRPWADDDEIEWTKRLHREQLGEATATTGLRYDWPPDQRTELTEFGGYFDDDHQPLAAIKVVSTLKEIR